MEKIETIRARNWTQGSVFRGTDLQLLKPAAEIAKPAELYIVASHPCDVVNSDLVREPRIDILPMKSLGKIDGNFTHGKNPRQLHHEWDGHGYEFDLIGRRTIERSSLALTRHARHFGPGDEPSSTLRMPS